MMRCTIIAVGKMKEPHWKDAEAEFLRRLAPDMRIEVIEVEAEALSATKTDAAAMRTEAERIRKRLPSGATIIALDRTGKNPDSEGFSALLEDLGGRGDHLAFVIGGSAGIDAELLKETQRRISLSAMTFTHEMARVILLEQLYRAVAILAGRPYHK
jgi:23S rRNA (pseudouridine1915-N3)-methyltransferase